ncbi:hypothetical protein HZH68_004304 [Vespula germanica]|uniref:Uncharacterized protein n=1 Tax=Vespula germanica TaxID=30212 RepID=A0A834NJN8_VESGE|nr:hypothetical protein HZH68_004304 [Vespula germanica]
MFSYILKNEVTRAKDIAIVELQSGRKNIVAASYIFSCNLYLYIAWYSVNNLGRTTEGRHQRNESTTIKYDILDERARYSTVEDQDFTKLSSTKSANAGSPWLRCNYESHGERCA